MENRNMMFASIFFIFQNVFNGPPQGLYVMTLKLGLVWEKGLTVLTSMGDLRGFHSSLWHWFPCIFSVRAYRGPTFVICAIHIVIFCNQAINKMYQSKRLTHYQTTNFRLFQTERVCRRQFQI